jgi:hypothetical protein
VARDKIGPFTKNCAGSTNNGRPFVTPPPHFGDRIAERGPHSRMPLRPMTSFPRSPIPYCLLPIAYCLFPIPSPSSQKSACSRTQSTSICRLFLPSAHNQPMHKFCQPESFPTGVNTSAQTGRSVSDRPSAVESVWSQSCLPCGAAKVRIQVLTQLDRGHSTKDYNPKKTGKTRSNTENRRGNSFVSNASRKHSYFQIFTAKHLKTKRLRDDINRGGV